MSTFLKISTVVLIIIFGLGSAVFYGLMPPDLAVSPQIKWVISDVTVVNPSISRVEHQTLIIEGGRIKEIRDHADTDPKSICKGCTVIPGLIDAHVHTPPSVVVGNQELFALMYLAHGVTSVRDVGQSEPGVKDFSQDLNQGNLVGPHMYRCGPVLEGNPPAWPVARIITNGEEGQKAVEELAADDVDCIKIYNEIDAEAYKKISETAKRYNIPVIGHVPHSVRLSGVSDFEAQHMTGVPYLTRKRPPLGWDIADEDIAAMSDQELDEALNVAKQRNISFTPTLANFRLRLIASDPIVYPPTPATKVMPDFWLNSWGLVAGFPKTTREIELKLQALEPMRAIVRAANAKHIDILAGTDTLMPFVVPGDALLLEIDELKLALGRDDLALRSATSVNGNHIDPNNIGSIAVGMRADLLLLPQDPSVDVKHLRDWSFVMTKGRLYERAQLDQWIEDYRHHFHGDFYQFVLGGLIDLIMDQFSHNEA